MRALWRRTLRRGGPGVGGADQRQACGVPYYGVEEVFVYFLEGGCHRDCPDLLTLGPPTPHDRDGGCV